MCLIFVILLRVFLIGLMMSDLMCFVEVLGNGVRMIGKWCMMCGFLSCGSDCSVEKLVMVRMKIERMSR